MARQPKKNFFLAELAKTLQKDKANVTRELDKLHQEGIVRVEEKGGKKFYGLNQGYDGIKELVGLLEKHRSKDFETKFKRSWLLAEDIPNMDPFFSQIWMNCFVKEFAEPSGRAYECIAAIYQDYHLWFYFDEKDAHAVAQNIVDRFDENPDFMDEVNREIVRHSDVLRDFAEKLPEEKLEKLSNQKLWQLYRDHEDTHKAYYQWAWIPVAVDMFTNHLTEYGKKLLQEIEVPEDKVNEYLTLLTQPSRPSPIKEEQDSLTKIAIAVQKDFQQLKLFQELFRKFKEEDVKEFGLYTHSPEYEAQFEKRVQELVETIQPKILQAVQEVYARYFYTKFIFTEEQGVYSFEHYLKALVRLVNRTPDLGKEFQEEEQELANIIQKREELIRKLKLTKRQRQIFDAWGEFMITKIYRRYAQLFALYKMTAIVEEIGRRLGLTLKQTRFMKTSEVEAGLSGGSVDMDEIKRRVEFSVSYADKNGRVFYSGAEAKKAAELIKGKEQDLSGIKELKGQVGCQGMATGTVKVVNVIEDMKKMEEGDILVAISTQPDLLPAMKKAAAFVTEQGGVTSHAAIVAREMNTPCVIGTKIATKVLKDGMKVEVDATKGIVRILD